MASPDLLSLDPDALARSEEKLRQKLNVGVPRRTFQQPGRPGRSRVASDVPVVVINQRRPTLTAALAAEDPAGPAPAEALRHEREAREQAEQALRQAQQTIRHLQAQLAHAEIAHAEGLAAEQQARERAEEAAREARENLEKLSNAAPRRRGRRRAGPASDAPSGLDEADPAAGQDEDTDDTAPVEWWRPGWRNLRT